MFRDSCRDAAQLFLLPLLAALLPWRLGFGLLQRAAKWPWVLASEVDQAFKGAATVSPIADRAAWQWEHRLVRMADHADLYLSLLRGDGWLRRHVHVQGSWPESGPFLAAFLHSGAGLWGLRHLRGAGHRAAFVSIRFDRSMYGNQPLRYWYACLRARATARAAGRPLIFTGNARQEMLDRLAHGENIVAALDVPPAGRSGVATRLFGRPAHLVRGVFDIAVESQVPIVLFTMRVHADTGERTLCIHPPIRGISAEALAAHFAPLLEREATENAPAWHFWGLVQAFFRQSAQDAGGSQQQSAPVESI